MLQRRPSAPRRCVQRASAFLWSSCSFPVTISFLAASEKHAPMMGYARTKRSSKESDYTVVLQGSESPRRDELHHIELFCDTWTNLHHYEWAVFLIFFNWWKIFELVEDFHLARKNRTLRWKQHPAIFEGPTWDKRFGYHLKSLTNTT